MATGAIQERSAAAVPPQERPTGMARLLRWALWAAGLCCLAVAIGPLVVEYAWQTWRSEHYQFAVLLLPAVLLLAMLRSRHVSLTPGSAWGRLVFWTTGILAAAAAVFAASPFVAVVALMLNLLAAIYECGGGALMRRLLPVWALACLAVRLPFDGDQKLVMGLQSIATGWASSLLDLYGLRHLVNGNAIRIAERDFFIDQACSGVHSLFAALAFAGFFSVASHRGLIRTLLLLAATVFWVLVANVLRIGAVVILASRYELPVTEGMGHDVLGIATFALAVALIMSTDRLLLFFVPERDRGPLALAPGKSWIDRPTEDVGVARAVTARRRGWIAPVLIATTFAALAWGGQMLPSAKPTSYQSQVLTVDGFKPVEVDDLPAEWNGWERVDFRVERREVGDLAGELSRIWTYRKGRLVVAVSVDGPYDGWHDLTWCYTGLGYRVDSVADETDTDSLVHTRLQLSNELGRSGLVLYSAFTESDRPISPPRAARHDALTRRVLGIFQRRLGPADVSRDERVYQVQTFAESGLGFAPEDHDEIERLFLEMRNHISGRLDQDREGDDT